MHPKISPPPSAPADAPARGWWQHVPVRFQPWIQLARLDRPVGVWLLFWPCVWATFLAPQPATVWGERGILLGLFALGALAARAAGCAYNDIVDRKLDAQVARTRGRPLASGRLSVRQAWLFIAAMGMVGGGVLCFLNRNAALVAVLAVALVALYPFMKRWTWWPQAWLGLTFNWGVLVGWVAVGAPVGVAMLALYAAGLFWTLGYDTLYALQDVEDDALAGIKSSARRLGAAAPMAIGWSYHLSSLCLAAALFLASGQALLGLLALPFWQQGCGQVRRLRGIVAGDSPPASGAAILKLFQSNRTMGAYAALACLIAGLLSAF